MIAPKLKLGDEIRIITPARSASMNWLHPLIETAKEKLESMGFKISFGDYVEEIDEFNSSPRYMRIDDLHDAFSDPNVKAILTVIGGYNSNQLLEFIDYELIRNNPKILCGYSDITALQNAIYAKTDMITYSGPAFFNFAMEKGFEYNEEYFKKCLMNEDSFEIKPSKKISEDLWGADQKNRTFTENKGWTIVNEGSAEGKIIGGNISTLALLQGTEYWPDIKNCVLFLEECDESTEDDIYRQIESLSQQTDFETVKAIVFGRIETACKVKQEKLIKIIKNNSRMSRIPVVLDVDFGHTNPMITFPIGGTVKLELKKESESTIEIIEH